MEKNFIGDNSTRSLEIDMDQIKSSDAFICIFSFLYGEIIGDKMLKECPIKRCKGTNCYCTNKKRSCTISFTEFEYRFAKSEGKTPIVIFNEEYDNFNAFEDIIKNFPRDQQNNFRPDYYDHIYRNRKRRFLDMITKNHVYPYKTAEEHSFENACNDAVSAAIKQICEKHKLSETFFTLKEPEPFHSFYDKGDYIEFEPPICGNITMIEKNSDYLDKDWEEARKYAYNLKKGGVDGWRIPTIEELEQIYNIKQYISKYINEYDAFFDICGLPDPKNLCFWSNSVSSSDTDSAWMKDFRTGHNHKEYKTLKFKVRCVR